MTEKEKQPDLPLGEPDDDSTGTGGADLLDPDDEAEDDHVVSDDYAADREESPDTSVLNTRVGDEYPAPGSDYNPDEPQPPLPCQKPPRKKRGEGKGSRGGKGGKS